MRARVCVFPALTCGGVCGFVTPVKTHLSEMPGCSRAALRSATAVCVSIAIVLLPTQSPPLRKPLCCGLLTYGVCVCVCVCGRKLEMEAKKAEEAIRAARRKAAFEAAAREEDAALDNNKGNSNKQPTDVVRPLRAAGSDDDDEGVGGGGGGAEGVPWGADGPPGGDTWDADMPEALRRRVRADTGDAVELGGGSFAEADGDDGPSDTTELSGLGVRVEVRGKGCLAPKRSRNRRFVCVHACR